MLSEGLLSVCILPIYIMQSFYSEYLYSMFGMFYIPFSVMLNALYRSLYRKPFPSGTYLYYNYLYIIRILLSSRICSIYIPTDYIRSTVESEGLSQTVRPYITEYLLLILLELLVSAYPGSGILLLKIPAFF